MNSHPTIDDRLAMAMQSSPPWLPSGRGDCFRRYLWAIIVHLMPRGRGLGEGTRSLRCIVRHQMDSAVAGNESETVIVRGIAHTFFPESARGRSLIKYDSLSLWRQDISTC
jgi:hypothetical protein